MTTDMTPERWAAIKQVLDRLLTLAPAERDRLLASLDGDMREEVATYLDVDVDHIANVLPTDVSGRGAGELLAGRYRVRRTIGHGGMGAVDEAYDERLDRVVAIKRLRNPWLADDVALKRLVAEGRALAALEHPNVERVLDAIDLPPALVLEYLQGQTLDAWLRGRREPALVLAVLRQVVEATAFAHAHGVVHCDLKPRNVIVSPPGQAKVIDFGIALLESRVRETVTSTATREAAFTPRYAAPEVRRGATPTTAADVYSLGVLIDEVVEGGDQAGAPLPPATVRALRAAATAARAEEAADRPRDAAALLALLPVAASPVVSRKRWRVLATTLLIVASSCIGGGIALFGDAPPTSTRTIAVVSRIDDAASKTVSAGAADLLKQALGPLRRARLVAGDVPAFHGGIRELVARLRDQGLSHVVIPTVAPFGSGVRMSVVVHRARDGSTVKTITRHGRADAMATLAREVAAELRAWLGETEAVLPEVATLVQPTPEAFELYSEARQYAARPDRPGNLDHAVSLLRQAVRLQPEFALAHAELGRVLLLQYVQRPAPELVINAQDALVEAQRHGGDAEDVLLGLAMAKQMTGRRAEAIPYLHRVLDANPANDRALRTLGAIETAGGRAAEGIDLLERAVAVRPSFSNYRVLGSSLFDEGRYAEALVAFTHLADLQPDNPWSYQMIGATYQRLGQADQTRAAYERSVEIRRTASSLTNLGTFYYEQGNLAEAERLYAEAVALEPHDPVYYRNLGDAQRQRGRREAARETYRQAVAAASALLRVDAGDIRALGNAAYASARAGECAVALAHAGRLATLAPTTVAALANRANAYALCERYVETADLLAQLNTRGLAPTAVLEKDLQPLLDSRIEFKGIRQ